jgi:hypothetical protein
MGVGGAERIASGASGAPLNSRSKRSAPALDDVSNHIKQSTTTTTTTDCVNVHGNRTAPAALRRSARLYLRTIRMIASAAPSTPSREVSIVAAACA